MIHFRVLCPVFHLRAIGMHLKQGDVGSFPDGPSKWWSTRADFWAKQNLIVLLDPSDAPKTVAPVDPIVEAPAPKPARSLKRKKAKEAKAEEAKAEEAKDGENG